MLVLVPLSQPFEPWLSVLSPAKVWHLGRMPLDKSALHRIIVGVDYGTTCSG